MKTTISNVWDKDKNYSEYFYKMSLGQSPEMFSAIALANLIKKIYKKDMSLLDVGCGTGHYLVSLRNAVNKNINYTGVDFSPSYIKLAQKAFGDSAKFSVGPIQKIPFKDKQFDIVMANNIILHVAPPPVQAIKELLRTSKKYIIIRTLIGERNYIMQEVLTNKDFGINKPDSNLFKSNGTPESFNYFNLYTEDYLRDTIKKLSPKAKVTIIKDLSYKNFDNQKTNKGSGAKTKVIDGKQVVGNIILDWRFIVIEK